MTVSQRTTFWSLALRIANKNNQFESSLRAWKSNYHIRALRGTNLPHSVAYPLAFSDPTICRKKVKVIWKGKSIMTCSPLNPLLLLHLWLTDGEVINSLLPLLHTGLILLSVFPTLLPGQFLACKPVPPAGFAAPEERCCIVVILRLFSSQLSQRH